jgi:hypothetical protein
MHTVQGGSNFFANSTYESLRSSSCTSCLVTDDHSVYWYPRLFFQDPQTGKFESVPNGGADVYYLFRGDADKNHGGPGLKAFPNGLKMLTGDASSVNPLPHAGSIFLTQPSIIGAVAGFTRSVINLARQPLRKRLSNGSAILVVTTTLQEGVSRIASAPRYVLIFTSQVAGTERTWILLTTVTTSPTLIVWTTEFAHRKPSLCLATREILMIMIPSTHPVPLPHLFIETFWDVNTFDSRWDGTKWPFVWSTGYVDNHSTAKSPTFLTTSPFPSQRSDRL